MNVTHNKQNCSLIFKMILKIDRWLFGKFQNQLEIALGNELVGACDSVLDLGCGAHSPIGRFRHKLRFIVGVDRFESSIEQSRDTGLHHEYRNMDVLEIGNHFEPNSFDCVVALDLIEHFTKEDGFRLILLMESIARKKIIIFTPNGFQPQQPFEDNPWQLHRSGWHVEEMQDMGFRVIGINGWKPLRGERTRMKWHPFPVWRRISYLTQIVTTTNPRYAHQILCVKNLK